MTRNTRVRLADARYHLEKLVGLLWPLVQDVEDSPNHDAAKLSTAGFWTLEQASEDMEDVYNLLEPEATGDTDTRFFHRATGTVAAIWLGCAYLAQEPELEKYDVVLLSYFLDAVEGLVAEARGLEEGFAEEDNPDVPDAPGAVEAERCASWLASALREMYIATSGDHSHKMDVIRDWLRESDVPDRIREPVLARLDRRGRMGEQPPDPGA